MTRRRRLALRLGLVALFVGAVAWIVTGLGWRRLLALASGADPRWLALSLVPVVARFPLWALKWWRMLGSGPAAAPYGFALNAVLAGAFVNLTTPTAKLAGGVLRAAALHRRTGCGRLTGYGWALADQLTNVLGNLALVAVLCLVAALEPKGGGPALVVPGMGAALLVAVLLGLRGAAGSRIRRPPWSRWIERMTPPRYRDEAAAGDGGWVGRLVDPFLRARAAPSAIVADVGLAAAAFATLALSNLMVLKALGVEAPWLGVLACASLGYLAGTLSGTMGGIGATELALIELWAAIGVPRETATAGALLHRAGFYLVTLAWGGGALAWLWRGSRRAAAG